MSGSDGSGSGWISKFLKVAGAAAATVAGGLIAALLAASANFQQEAAFGARRESGEREHGEPWSRMQANNNMAEKWEKPKIGWVKLNVGGSRDHYNGVSAGCGGVLRDSSGKWVRGFAKKLDSSLDVHQTELEAILAGLEFASDIFFKKDTFFKKVVVESDDKYVVSMVKNSVKPIDPDYHVILQIRRMLHFFDWEVKLVAISNSANSVADRLAKNARTLSSDDPYQEYLVPPDNCLLFLHRDWCVSSLSQQLLDFLL